MIAQATLPESSIDRNRIRDSLAPLRLGHDGLEQFVGLLFDELDSLREQLDEERMQIDEQRHGLREREAQIAAERSQWETDRQHWHDALQKRVVELERDRLALAAELESERRRTSEMAQAAADQHRQFVAERAEWAAELRGLRQSSSTNSVTEGRELRDEASKEEAGGQVPEARIEAPIDLVHAEEESLKIVPRRNEKKSKHPTDIVIGPPLQAKGAPGNPFQADPVMGPLLSQFQQLQKDVARRREKKSYRTKKNGRGARPTTKKAVRIPRLPEIPMSQRFAILPWITAIVAAASIAYGEYLVDERLVACGAGGLVGVALVVAATSLHRSNPRGRRIDFGRDGNTDRAAQSSSAKRVLRSEPTTSATRKPLAGDVDSLVEQMLSDGRFALLLRPQIAGNLVPEMLAAAQEDLDHRMALVPDGIVQIEPNRLSALAELDVPEEALERVTIHVAVTYLDRYPVTNRQYQAFVDAGGYEQMAIWEPAVWPAVLDFVDTTGRPGPRYWADGHFPPGKDDHPVVGVCWYEAAAFARWVGRRLPTDAEWVKAASWPVNISPTNCVQRKYPWGNSMERQRANLWGSGAGDTVPTDQFASGVSVGGIYQLIGNVWEWTADDFHWIAALADERTKQPQLKTIRGGAFDTYFDNQATSQFASGEDPLGRKHNVGFRCAVGICDLAATAPEPVDENTEHLEEATCEVV